MEIYILVIMDLISLILQNRKYIRIYNKELIIQKNWLEILREIYLQTNQVLKFGALIIVQKYIQQIMLYIVGLTWTICILQQKNLKLVNMLQNAKIVRLLLKVSKCQKENNYLIVFE